MEPAFFAAKGGALMDMLRILSGLAGLSETREMKAVELKVGQVVRGVLLKMLSEQEGIVSIAGVPVRARLETPLKPGEATMLQVQPSSPGGEIVLKPVGPAAGPLSDRSVADWLLRLGLADTANNRLLLQVMHAAGLPLERTAVRAMREAAAGRPEGTDAREWLQAAAAAQTKGLPLTKDTVQALHAALFGKSAGAALGALRRALADVLQDNGSGRFALPQAASQAAERLAALLDRAAGLLEDRLLAPAARRAGEGAGQTRPAGAWPETDTGAARGGRAGADADNGPGRTDRATAGQTAVRPAAGGAQPRGSAASEPAPGGAAAFRTADGGLQPAANAAGRRGAAPDGTAARSGEPAAGGDAAPRPGVGPAGDHAAVFRPEDGRPSGEMRPSPPSAGQAAAARSAVSGTPSGVADPAGAWPAQRPEPWIAALLRDLGLDHEHRLMERALHGFSDGQSAEALRETAKGLVMTLLAHEAQLPQALRDALQQTLQTLTGQQLLLAADRQAPVAVVTLSIPLFHPESGEQAATVHIHARRGKGETLDADNCRLLFDLNLERLGRLLMDVQVVDRMVAVRLLCDHPAAEALAENGRQEAEDALAGIGYRLVSLQSQPLPEPPKREGGNGSPGGRPDGPDVAAAAFGTDPGGKPYRGVDLRI
jgi:hypothetical protein